MVFYDSKERVSKKRDRSSNDMDDMSREETHDENSREESM